MKMKTFEERIDELVSQAEALLADADQASQTAMPGGVFFLKNNEVLALPRDNGYSRYPYGQDGFNFWVYASGYMHANEGLFSHFLRAAEGQEPNIAFFAGLRSGDNKIDVLPLLPVPQCHRKAAAKQAKRYTILSSNAAYFVTQLSSLRFVLRIFVTTTKDICFSVHVRNLSDQPQSLYLSSYFNPFLRHQIFESGEDRWFKEMRVLEPSPDQGDLGSFIVKVNEDKDRLHSVSHYGVIRRGLTPGPNSRLTGHEETTSRYQYVGGTRSSLHTPASLYQGTFGDARHLTAFTETGIAGDLLHLNLGANDTARFNAVFSHTDDTTAADRLAQSAIDIKELDTQLRTMEQADAARHSGLAVTVANTTDPRIKPRVFNAFFEHLKRQVEFCSLIKGYIQLSPNSLIGIRDVFQALEALAYWRPNATRAKMLEALGYTTPSGRCFRQYSLPSGTGGIGRMDLRPFIDQGVWVISTIATYLRVTGDTEFLNEVCGYHEIVDEPSGLVKQSNKKDTVIEHLIRIMDYMLKNRDRNLTGCVRALYGDWNDALDGLGISKDPKREYGTGVSVMATLQVYQNCHEMIEMLKALDPDKLAYPARINEYHDAARELGHGLTTHAIVKDANDNKRIVHGWGDQMDYLVGSYNDPDGKARDGLTSNAFWVLSGMIKRDESLGKTILDALDRLDSKYGYKTFEPYFAEDAPGVGRIRKLPAGTAENGAAYVHATTFAIMALFQMGQPKKAWDQLAKVLPFTDIHEHLSHSPFVMPNAYGLNEEKGIDGQNMNDWQTGSSNVVFKTLIRYVFGFEPTIDGLWIQPAAWLPFKSFRFTAPRARGCEVRIVFEDKSEGNRTFTVNGKPRQGTLDPAMGIDKLWIPYEELTGDWLEVRVTQ